jgi:primosomal protein DnaI
VTGFAREEVGQFFLTLQGNNGVGKSHLLQAMAREVMDQGFVVRYVYAPQFLDDLRQTFNKHRDNEASFDQVFNQYKTPYLLVVDDLARGHYSEWGVAQMELLIEFRYRNQLKTAFGTNYSDSEIAEKLGLMITDRVFDIGSGAALVAPMGGPSYRTKKEW